MIEGHDIIVFANDWTGDPLSKKHIVQRLAARNRILWVNSLGNRNPSATVRDFRRAADKVGQWIRGSREVADNIHVFAPLVIPYHGYATARMLNRRLLVWSLRRECAKLGFRDPITWSFVPSSGEVAGSLGEKLLVYHCVDEYSKFTGTNESAILAMERRMMERADLVIVSSDRLLETKRPFNSNTVLITHGVDVPHFRKACTDALPPPPGAENLRGPVIGFFGLIADWVDLETVRHLAASRPDWSVVLIGEIQTDVSALRALPNVHFPGRRPYQELPAWCRKFDVAILPFVNNELTLAANPLKMREYLAAGLPVVASPLPEVLKYSSMVRTAGTPTEFLQQAEGCLNRGNGSQRLMLSRRMDSESWDRKVEEMSEQVEALSRAPSGSGGWTARSVA